MRCLKHISTQQSTKKEKQLCSRYPLTHTKGTYFCLFMCHPNPNLTANPSHHQMNQNSSKGRTPQPLGHLCPEGEWHHPANAQVAPSRMISTSCLHKASINPMQLCGCERKPMLPPPVRLPHAPLRSSSSEHLAFTVSPPLWCFSVSLPCSLPSSGSVSVCLPDNPFLE